MGNHTGRVASDKRGRHYCEGMVGKQTPPKTTDSNEDDHRENITGTTLYRKSRKPRNTHQQEHPLVPKQLRRYELPEEYTAAEVFSATSSWMTLSLQIHRIFSPSCMISISNSSSSLGEDAITISEHGEATRTCGTLPLSSEEKTLVVKHQGITHINTEPPEPRGFSLEGNDDRP
ncbi:hypothetical protein H4219_001551 [Mycoemilia scoparia]|uniref:Uncharacterized protein n=1 Tax=Mycoemilia scoparia TaxID=417184 RepID=A0A9W8DW05_9FUNG|nr:hypothetical protein H4219_001551 [Mycoemilia scoparia]